MKPDIVIVQQEVAPGVFKGRWGYFSCDYKTYLMLKKVRKYYFKSLAQAGNWKRWKRKAQHNRVIREKIRNDQGQVVGYKVTGPRPKPYVNPLYAAESDVDVQIWTGSRYTTVRDVELILDPLGDISHYLKAYDDCFPWQSPENVRPFKPDKEQLAHLVGLIEKQEQDKFKGS